MKAPLKRASFLCLALPCLLSAKSSSDKASSSTSLDKSIESFFETFNVKSNSSSIEVIHSQMGSHFLGGSGAVRAGVYDTHPIHTHLPTFSAGCGGIDYTLGGINIASKDEMKAALKSIASNGVGYAFLLATETISPVIASTMKQVQTWANELNAININSCNIASGLVQGMWPKTQAASSYICEHGATQSPLFRDLIEAKHGCRDDRSKQQAAVQRVQKNNKDILAGNYNVAWKALERFNLDEGTKNLFMNITGTIVVQGLPHDKAKPPEVQFYPPKDKKVIDLIRLGGELKEAYQIAGDKIHVSTTTLNIHPENAWKTRVYKTLLSIHTRILSEKEGQSASLSSDEKDLISTTHFPIGSLVSLMAHYNGKASPLALERYSDLIAFERVIKFVEDVVRDILGQAEALRGVQTGGELNQYLEKVYQVLQDLQAMKMENIQKISAEHELIAYLMQVDRNSRDQTRGF